MSSSGRDDSSRPTAASDNPIGRCLIDSLRLGNESGLPVEFQSASSHFSSETSAVRASLHQQFPVGSRSNAALSAFGLDEGGTTRRSQRAIKRKKFDDEIVDSSPSTPATAPASFSHQTVFPMPSQVFPTPSGISPSAAAALALRSVGKGSGIGKNLRTKSSPLNISEGTSMKKSKLGVKKKKPKRDIAFKDLGRWKPTDDLALITAILQTNDMHAVHRGIKFSCHFTYSEISTRWHALMYKPIISKLALQAIKNLHPEIVLAVQRKTLLSRQEKEVLYTLKSTSNPQLCDFEELLSKNSTQFHFARTPRCLQHHWQSLKQYTLLPDQSVQPLMRDNPILNFLDAESSINESELFDVKDDVLDSELAFTNRRTLKEIRLLEADIQKWQVLVDKVRGDNSPDFDNQTLAVLRGRLVRYLMRSKEITLGRTAKGQKVDVDLKLEGPAWKISRRQGVIKLKNTGEFYIANEGKRSLFVDGRPILRGCKTRLNNNSVLEIAGLKFVFLINQDLIEAVRQEASKMYQNS